MREFHVRFQSSQDVQAFIAWAAMQPFTISVGRDNYYVNGNSFMGMFTLDHSRPLRATVSCTDEQFQQLIQEADRFLVK